MRVPTLEIDNHADGTIDFDTTARADRDGVARFNRGAPPFAVAEGDTVKMHDRRWGIGFVILYVTLDWVDPSTNVIRGRARAGTRIIGHVHDPALPSFQGPDVSVIADASGTWTADIEW